jgi:hypothetical protein
VPGASAWSRHRRAIIAAAGSLTTAVALAKGDALMTPPIPRSLFAVCVLLAAVGCRANAVTVVQPWSMKLAGLAKMSTARGTLDQVMFWNNGSLRTRIDIPATGIRVSIRAKGNKYLEEWPKLRVDVDDRAVAILTVDSATPADYSVRVPSQSSGSAVLGIELINGAASPGDPLASRHVVVERVAFGP